MAAIAQAAGESLPQRAACADGTPYGRGRVMRMAPVLDYVRSMGGMPQAGGTVTIRSRAAHWHWRRKRVAAASSFCEQSRCPRWRSGRVAGNYFGGAMPSIGRPRRLPLASPPLPHCADATTARQVPRRALTRDLPALQQSLNPGACRSGRRLVYERQHIVNRLADSRRSVLKCERSHSRCPRAPC